MAESDPMLASDDLFVAEDVFFNKWPSNLLDTKSWNWQEMKQRLQNKPGDQRWFIVKDVATLPAEDGNVPFVPNYIILIFPGNLPVAESKTDTETGTDSTGHETEAEVTWTTVVTTVTKVTTRVTVRKGQALAPRLSLKAGEHDAYHDNEDYIPDDVVDLKDERFHWRKMKGWDLCWLLTPTGAKTDAMPVLGFAAGSGFGAAPTVSAAAAAAQDRQWYGLPESGKRPREASGPEAKRTKVEDGGGGFSFGVSSPASGDGGFSFGGSAAAAAPAAGAGTFSFGVSSSGF